MYFQTEQKFLKKQLAGNLENIWPLQTEWLMRRHFQKSQSIEPKEIKCLSLIFINQVANYKGENPKIKFLQKNTNKFIPSFMM